MEQSFDAPMPEALPPAPEKRAWDWKSALAVLGLFFIFFALVNVIQGILLINANGGLEHFRTLKQSELEIPFSITVVTLIGIALSVAASVLLVGLVFRRLTLAEIGFRPAPIQWVLLAAGIAIPLAVVRIAVAAGVVLLWPESAAGAEAVGQMLSSGTDPIAIGMLFLLVGILGPLYEETLFRGFFFSWMRNRWSFWPAAIFSSALFGIFHLNIPQGVSAFILGLALAWLFEKSRSLWPSIMLHVVTNLFAEGLIYLAILLKLPMQ
jgi:membrane protease YdiL (CAAX protease family)